MMIALVTSNQEMQPLKPKVWRKRKKVLPTVDLKHKHIEIKYYILLVHTFSDYDTTSAICKKGRKQVLKFLKLKAV